MLKFEGGSISGVHTITGAYTRIETGPIKIFTTNVTLVGTWNVAEAYSEWFGAIGDGLTDDTVAIQKTLDYFDCITLISYKTYLVTTTITIPRNKSLNGNRAKIVASSNFTENSIGRSVPTKTIIYIQSREAVQSSEKLMTGSFVRDLKISGNSDNTGLFIGTENDNVVTDTTVNNCVYGYNISNIVVNGCNVGMEIDECWNSVFEKINISDVTTYGLYIHGQSVNNVFNSCRCYGGSEALRIEHKNYANAGGNKRPEGCSFNGGFFGSAGIGINIVSCLAFYFSNCIIDLNTDHAVDATDPTDVTFNSCFIYASGNTSVGVYVGAVSTLANNTYLKVIGCKIAANQGFYVGTNQKDIFLNNNEISQSVASSLDNSGTVYICDNVFNSGNMFSASVKSGNLVITRGNTNKNENYLYNIQIPRELSVTFPTTGHTDYLKIFKVSPSFNGRIGIRVGNVTIDNLTTIELDFRNGVVSVLAKGGLGPWAEAFSYKNENGSIVVYYKSTSTGIAQIGITMLEGSFYVSYDPILEWVDNNSGATPCGYMVGSWYMNTSVSPKRPVFWDGSEWVDATGASV